MKKRSRLISTAWLLGLICLLVTAVAYSADAQFDDISAGKIYADLKERGVDVVVGAPVNIRRAYARYDTALGNGHGLNTGSADATKSAAALNSAFGQLKLTSDVRVRTANVGARIRYKLVGADQIGALPQLSNSAEDNLAIGIYMIWSERESVQTSVPTAFRIIAP